MDKVLFILALAVAASVTSCHPAIAADCQKVKGLEVCKVPTPSEVVAPQLPDTRTKEQFTVAL